MLLFRMLIPVFVLILTSCKEEKEGGFQESTQIESDEMSHAVVNSPDSSSSDFIEFTPEIESPEENLYQVVIVGEAVARLVPFSSCKEIKSEVADAPSGSYPIRIRDAEGVDQDIMAYCDMVTDEGGWTLIANYVHMANTTPPTQIRNQDLPLLGSDVLGANEAATPYWGHAANGIINFLDPVEIRMQCRTSDHNRIFDFKTNLNSCISYLKTGLGSCANVNVNFTGLNNHNAMLPGTQDQSEGNMGNDWVIYDVVGRRSTRHWRIGTNNNEWECDNNPNNAANNTIHRVWAR